MKIGIFPGSFNPVHIGHLAIANYVAEFGDFDEIWFLITPKNPLKVVTDLMDQEFRLELIEKAVGKYPKFKTCTIEWDMPQPTYTINTLQKLRMLFPDHTFELIIGSDNWETIHRWKDYQMILKNFKTLVYPRLGTGKVFINHPNAKMIKGAPKIEISSSVIRKSLKQGKDVRFYMPTGIYEDLIAADFFKKEEPVTEDTTESPMESPEENIEK
ncbi:MAG: nicotinate-nucleotide adenylyltransferase [Dysgonamonadaceae bacterium]|jgi:nicotinate-nucleotide adenylyltransferase|nr:nicotinate-nucleotide adenylyltransferase [Dysgonamonadaceae bacterium]